MLTAIPLDGHAQIPYLSDVSAQDALVDGDTRVPDFMLGKWSGVLEDVKVEFDYSVSIQIEVIAPPDGLAYGLAALTATTPYGTVDWCQFYLRLMAVNPEPNSMVVAEFGGTLIVSNQTCSDAVFEARLASLRGFPFQLGLIAPADGFRFTPPKLIVQTSVLGAINQGALYPVGGWLTVDGPAQPDASNVALQPIYVCLAGANSLQWVAAQFNPITGDTTILRNAFYPDAPFYAADRDWYIQSWPIEVGGARYEKFGLPRVLPFEQVGPYDVYDEMYIYRDRGASGTPEILYAPVAPGCQFQAYRLSR